MRKREVYWRPISVSTPYYLGLVSTAEKTVIWGEEGEANPGFQVQERLTGEEPGP